MTVTFYNDDKEVFAAKCVYAYKTGSYNGDNNFTLEMIFATPIQAMKVAGGDDLFCKVLITYHCAYCSSWPAILHKNKNNGELVSLTAHISSGITFKISE